MRADHEVQHVSMRLVEILPSGLALAVDMEGSYRLHDFDTYYGYTGTWPSPKADKRWRLHIFADPKPRNRYVGTAEEVLPAFRKMALKIPARTGAAAWRGKLMRPSPALRRHVMQLILERGR